MSATRESLEVRTTSGHREVVTESSPPLHGHDPRRESHMELRQTNLWSTRTYHDDYIRDSALGELQLAEQETISAHIVKALGSPHGLA